MSHHERGITLIGGPTASIEDGGFAFLTDPTFDAPGEYKLPHVTLKKLARPALTAEQTGPIDAALLSHDQHADNFDQSGKEYAIRAPLVLTTAAGAKGLGGVAEGLAPGERRESRKPHGSALTVTATLAPRPGRHRTAVGRCDWIFAHLRRWHAADLHRATRSGM